MQLCSDFYDFIFAYVLKVFKRIKKIYFAKKNVNNIFYILFRNYFFLESSETSTKNISSKSQHKKNFASILINTFCIHFRCIKKSIYIYIFVEKKISRKKFWEQKFPSLSFVGNFTYRPLIGGISLRFLTLMD